ncbi:MAG: nascent polypeptide-associated complex protein [Candidatus Altiarchaeales archaeon WOR_SM1_86-2]|nr:MAG: nascent polypeptide-associated complex protein [Candidatus Altiarchaeales archaeon WOR_SM1_86-2]
MFPGGVNPKQMKQMMKRMGMKMDEIDADVVIIRGMNREIVIENPQVAKISMQGKETFQITGDVSEKEVEEGGEAAVEINEEDVEMVAQQAGVSSEDARKALEEANGDLAEAIMRLKG